MEYELISVTEKEIFPFINDVAHLRMQVFRDYPYLYDGDLAYEQKYLQTYCQAPQSLVVLIRVAGKIVGASTAVPLKYETNEFQAPFIQQQLPIEQIYYFGESVLLPAYRGHGIYPRIFAERERFARLFNYSIATFCAVERPVDDPRRPKNYVPLNHAWQKFGYEKHPELIAYYEWKEIDAEKSTYKPLIFWMKNL